MYISFKKKTRGIDRDSQRYTTIFISYIFIYSTYLLKYEEKIILKSTKNATCIFFVKKFSRTLKKNTFISFIYKKAWIKDHHILF